MELHEARRVRLRKWIDTHYSGNAANFAKSIGKSQPQLADMLRGAKAFGERVAASLEVACKMPKGYLVRPESGEIKEPSVPYHGVMLTIGGALIGAEWEKLPLKDRVEIEAEIRRRVATTGRAKPL